MLKFVRAAMLPLFLLTVPAAAQTAAPQPPQVDQRIAGQTIRAQSALLDLREAEMRALAQDNQKKVADLEAKVKDLEARLNPPSPEAPPADPAPAAEPPK